MLLSDRLIEIGSNVDPQDFQSLHNAEVQMLAELSKALQQSTMKHIITIINFVCEHLNRKGFSYYKPEHFITKTK